MLKVVAEVKDVEILLLIHCTLKNDVSPKGSAQSRFTDVFVTPENERFLTMSGSMERIVCYRRK